MLENMQKVLLPVAVACLLAPLLGCDLATGSQTSRKQDPGPSKAKLRAEAPDKLSQEAVVSVERIGSMVRAKLDNGLTVLVAENHAAPVVAIQVWLGVGSADEGPGEQGLAHLQEHMLFKGTKKRGVGEIARAIEGAGGEINAWTSFDQTVYHVVLASQFFDLGLDVLSDAVLNAAFDATELEREKQVVLEEIKRSRDMPGRHLGDLLFSTSYDRHGYGRPVLGTAKSVSGVDRKTIRAFHRRHYRAGRLSVVVVGVVDANRVLTRVLKLFGAVAAGRAKAAVRQAEPAQRKLRIKIVRDDIQETHLGLAFRIPEVRHADVPALDLLATLLGQGESSRLNLELKRGLNLVNDAYAYAYTPPDPGVFVVGASAQTDKVSEILFQLGRQLARLGTTPVGAAELAKVKSMVESDTLYMRETVQGLARRLGYYQVMLNDPAYGDRYLGQILGLTSDDLMRVARTYLAPQRASVVALLPQDQAKGLNRAGVVKALRDGFASAPSAGPVKSKTEAGVRRVKIRNGPTVLIQEDHANALVSVRAVFLGGTRFEDEANSGINSFLAGLLTRGTASRTADDVAREIDGIAGSMDGFSGRNTFGLRADFPARFFDRGLALFADCLQNPLISESEIRRERELTLEEIASRDDNLAGLAFDLFAATLYDAHPYRLTILGSRKSIAGLRRKGLREYFESRFTPDRMVLSVVGDVDADRVLEQVRALFSTGKKSALPPRLALGLDPVPAQKRLAVKHRSRAQAHMVLGFMGTTLASRERHALEVLTAVLAGQGGRLFVDLRDKRSLAYSVTGFSLEGIEPGFVAIYLGVDPQRTPEALAAALDQLQAVRDKPVSKTELARAQRYLVGTHAISLQRTAVRAASLAFNELYGLGYLAHTKYAEQIMKVTREDLQRVARKYFKLDAYVLTVVGPQDRLPDLTSD
jgi:zinc protease